LDLAISLWGDKKVTEYIGGPFSKEEITERLKREIDNYKNYKIQYWPLYLKDNNNFIGGCGLRPYKEDTLDLKLTAGVRCSCRVHTIKNTGHSADSAKFENEYI
jgi:RimJ/RimL family protein N-acetyltransferase